MREDFKGEKKANKRLFFSSRKRNEERGVNDLEEKLISMESKIDSRPADTGNGIRDEGEQSREMKPLFARDKEASRGLAAQRTGRM